MFWKILLSFFLILIIPQVVFARVTPEDIYQAKRTEFESSLAKIQDPVKKQLVIQTDQVLKEINLAVCGRFDNDIARLAAILEEEKSRQNVTNTRVAYGQGDTPLDSAAYYINYAAEALAYQKIQDYTPQIQQGNLTKGVENSLNNLRVNLTTVQGKIIRAKSETQKALKYYGQ